MYLLASHHAKQLNSYRDPDRDFLGSCSSFSFLDLRINFNSDSGRYSIAARIFYVLCMLCLKGLCHEMNIFLKAYNNKYVLSLHAMIVFTIIFFSVDKKIKVKVLACSLKFLTNLKILPVNRYKGPKAANLTLEMLTGSRL
jgi:hypothetical protein